MKDKFFFVFEVCTSCALPAKDSLHLNESEMPPRYFDYSMLVFVLMFKEVCVRSLR